MCILPACYNKENHKTRKRHDKTSDLYNTFCNRLPPYIAKAERKGRTKTEVDEIIQWLTGYSQKELNAQIELQTDLETFFANAPKPSALRKAIKGMVCGIRVEEIKEPIMQEIRYLDKLIDELAQGKTMDKILRKQ